MKISGVCPAMELPGNALIAGLKTGMETSSIYIFTSYFSIFNLVLSLSGFIFFR